jgi:hypothetical protein
MGRTNQTTGTDSLRWHRPALPFNQIGVGGIGIPPHSYRLASALPTEAVLGIGTAWHIRCVHEPPGPAAPAPIGPRTWVGSHTPWRAPIEDATFPWPGLNITRDWQRLAFALAGIFVVLVSLIAIVTFAVRVIISFLS